MRIYLDNNATTQIHPDVLALLERELRATYGNASSVHEEGQRARRLLEEARESVAALLGASPREVVFTSGGSESNNAAVIGAAAEHKGAHIVTTAIEHPSVLEVVRLLERGGHRVTFVPCDRDGVVSAAAIEAALRDDTAVVAMMLANNETGVLQPVAEVGALCRRRAIHLHCDAVQAAGRVLLDCDELGVDTLAVSGHKMHAPKGIGALYVRSGVTLQSLLVGGAQERRRRAGTENVPLAAAFGAAARIAVESAREPRVRLLRDRFESGVIAALPFATVNGAAAERLPNTSNICFRGHDGEGIVIALDLAGIAVSSGAACSSGRVEPSHVLLAMGLSMEDARSSVRFSLSEMTTGEEVERAIALVREIVPKHRSGAAPPLEVKTTTS